MVFQTVVEITEEELTGLIDENASKRVVETLLSNAIHHSAGNIRISLDQQDGFAILVVKNTVKTNYQIQEEKLFERFYTTDQTRQSSRGLGLTIVQSLMNRQGGEITAQLQGEDFIITNKWELIK